jgi:prepilin peptidase CpaA
MRFPIVHLSPLVSNASTSQHGLCKPMILDIGRLVLFPALMAFAAASDLFTMTISNRVSLALIAGFLALALLGGMGLHDMLMHIGAGAAVLVVAFACFAMGWVGGGDAKVVACVALWFGFDHLLDYLVYASLFGGALTLLLLQFRQWPLPYPLAGQAWLNRLHDRQSGIPYGIALALGALMVYPETEWIKAVDLTHLAIG